MIQEVDIDSVRFNPSVPQLIDIHSEELLPKPEILIPYKK